MERRANSSEFEVVCMNALCLYYDVHVCEMYSLLLYSCSQTAVVGMERCLCMMVLTGEHVGKTLHAKSFSSYLAAHMLVWHICVHVYMELVSVHMNFNVILLPCKA